MWKDVWPNSSSYFRVAAALLISSSFSFSPIMPSRGCPTDWLGQFVCVCLCAFCASAGLRSLCIIVLSWMKCPIRTLVVLLRPLNKTPQTINAWIKHTYCRQNTNTNCQPAASQEGRSLIGIKTWCQRHKQRDRTDADIKERGQTLRLDGACDLDDMSFWMQTKVKNCCCFFFYYSPKKIASDWNASFSCSHPLLKVHRWNASLADKLHPIGPQTSNRSQFSPTLFHSRLIPAHTLIHLYRERWHLCEATVEDCLQMKKPLFNPGA